MTDSQTPRGQQRWRSRLLLYGNMVIVIALLVSLGGVSKQLISARGEQRSLSHTLDDTQVQLAQLRWENTLELDAINDRDQVRVADWTEERRLYRVLLDSMTERMAVIEEENRASVARSAESLREELATFRADIATELENEKIVPRKSVGDIFRDVERTQRDGVLLIYTEFDYYRLVDGERDRKRTITSWGTGFVATAEGHVITCKHVIQPWKFDSDLAAMQALGEIEIDSGSLRIGAWQSGERALDAHDKPSFRHGFNNNILKNLSLFAIADDSWKPGSVDFGNRGPAYRLHALDNQDLAILKLKDAEIVPLAIGHSAALKKLDPVMALGFPRGQSGLEGRIAESSPSIGTVRKIEDTIHITASIIPGNSGGPLIGPDGRVTGIVTRIYTETLGICIKIERALDLIKRSENDAKARRVEAAAAAKSISEAALGRR